MTLRSNGFAQHSTVGPAPRSSQGPCIDLRGVEDRARLRWLLAALRDLEPGRSLPEGLPGASTTVVRLAA